MTQSFSCLTFLYNEIKYLWLCISNFLQDSVFPNVIFFLKRQHKLTKTYQTLQIHESNLAEEFSQFITLHISHDGPTKHLMFRNNVTKTTELLYRSDENIILYEL